MSLISVLVHISVTEYKVWVLEARVQQQYTAYLSILNRNFSTDLSSHNSPVFKKEAKGVERMVSRDHQFLWHRCPKNLGHFIGDPVSFKGFLFFQ